MVENERQMVSIAIKAAEDKKAKDIMLLDLAELSPVCDYFLICSGASTVQVKAIAENIKDKMRENDLETTRIEGLKDAHWVLMDYGDLVIHVFLDEERYFYNLERLWADARVIDLQYAY